MIGEHAFFKACQGAAGCATVNQSRRMNMSSHARNAIEALPAAFLSEKAANAKATLQLDLSGDDGGEWILKVSEGTCTVHEGIADQPDATVTMEANDFIALFKNELDPIRAFMAGKIKVSGNMGLMMQFLNWFKRG
jgi:putative sterol carrier protein